MYKNLLLFLVISCAQADATVLGLSAADECSNIDVTQEVNVRCYGAVGDGKTDDTQAMYDAIWRALDRHGRDHGTATVRIPAGNYVIRLGGTIGAWRLSESVRIIGDGSKSTVITAVPDPACTDCGLILTQNATDVTIKGLSLIRRNDFEDAGAIGISRTGKHGTLVVSDVIMANWFNALTSDDGDYTLDVSDTEMYGLVNMGVIAGGGCAATQHFRRVSVHDGYGRPGVHGLYLQNPFRSIVVEDSEFYNLSGWGIHRYGTHAISCQEGHTGSAIIKNNHFFGGMRAGIILDGSYDYRPVVTGNTFDNFLPKETRHNSNGIQINCNGAVITGNTFNGSLNVSIVGEARNGVITGNAFNIRNTGIEPGIGVSFGEKDQSGWVVSGNTFTATTPWTYPVMVTGARQLLVTGNLFNTMGSGIYLYRGLPDTEAPVDVDVLNNVFYGDATDYGAINIHSDTLEGAVRVKGNTFRNRGCPIVYSGPYKLIANDNTFTPSPECEPANFRR